MIDQQKKDKLGRVITALLLSSLALLFAIATLALPFDFMAIFDTLSVVLGLIALFQSVSATAAAKRAKRVLAILSVSLAAAAIGFALLLPYLGIYIWQ